MRAAARDEVLLFDEAGTNTVVGFGLEKPFDEHLFDGCEAVVTAEIVNQRLAAAPLETRAAAAQWGDDGRLTLWCSTQNAQATRDEVAGWLGIEPGRLRVITPGRRRRLRREDRRRPGVRARGVAREADGPRRCAGARPARRT